MLFEIFLMMGIIFFVLSIPLVIFGIMEMEFYNNDTTLKFGELLLGFSLVVLIISVITCVLNIPL